MRKIIHIDMDAFFAAVEQRDNPQLRGKAIAVGGRPDARGVVSTASYEARQFGIHSAMPMATAVRHCPQLIIIPPRGSYYRDIAQQIRQIFTRFTDLIEPLSIDEAYLDVSDNGDFNGSATLLARHILDTINTELSLTASAGVSYCKFLAKYASNINKPNGVFTITPTQASEIIDAMPVEKFHGIGPATQKKLNDLTIFTGKDLRQANLEQLTARLGKTAEFYYRLAHGEDNRALRVSRQRKSLGNEITFSQDTADPDELQQKLHGILQKTWQQLSRQDLMPMTLTLKLKYHDFSLQTKRYTERSPIAELQSAEIIANALLRQRQTDKPVRLIGVAFSQLVPKTRFPRQLRLFD